MLREKGTVECGFSSRHGAGRPEGARPVEPEWQSRKQSPRNDRSGNDKTRTAKPERQTHAPMPRIECGSFNVCDVANCNKPELRGTSSGRLGMPRVFARMIEVVHHGDGDRTYTEQFAFNPRCPRVLLSFRFCRSWFRGSHLAVVVCRFAGSSGRLDARVATDAVAFKSNLPRIPSALDGLAGRLG